jgi:hypothetical protein
MNSSRNTSRGGDLSPLRDGLQRLTMDVIPMMDRSRSEVDVADSRLLYPTRARAIQLGRAQSVADPVSRGG